MSRRKQIRSKEQFAAALELEKAGDTTGALKLYQKSTATDPANSHAWNRQMILLRKAKSKEDEVKLIKLALAEYQKSHKMRQQDWLKQNQAKADSSRELAQVLGLLEPTGLPRSDDTIIEKWQTRLYLLEYRIKNARKKQTPIKKTINMSSKPKNHAPVTPKTKNAGKLKPLQKK
ncbi:MAG: tetratricopeptide repeat protein [Chitinophagaceae bacterium]|nr:MAG: tetratricopeptide repeat protein [Chitinophagaceae bacterium]